MNQPAFFSILILVSGITFSALADTPASVVQAMTSQQLIQAGREAFMNRCSGCHGVNADGNGPAAKMLNPKPRNLVSGNFKLRSTPSGVLPTVDDLLRTLEQGIPGTSMPSFRELSSQEKLSLVAFVRSLRPEFKETYWDQVPIALPPMPKDSFSTKAGLFTAAARGKKVFIQSCQPCHGESGQGNGTSAEGMVDNDERPIKPADLTARQVKGGATARDLFRAISTGLDGAPMPGYAEQLSEGQRWDLVAYIFYLRGKRAGIYVEDEKLP